jgi:hypothetical protein
VLSGEKWSDHPACTHPAISALARAVNDCTSDTARSALAPLIPTVIGLGVYDGRVHDGRVHDGRVHDGRVHDGRVHDGRVHDGRGDDKRFDERIAVLVAARAGVAALPIACESRQRTIAVGLLYAGELLARPAAQPAGAPPTDELRSAIDGALASAPLAHQWAATFSAGLAPKSGNSRHAMRVLTTISVLGIADACVPDADARLERLLRLTLAEVAALGSTAPVSRKSVPEFANA